MLRIEDVRAGRVDVATAKTEVAFYGRVAEHVRNAIEIAKIQNRPATLALTE
jgi:osmotically-inducible protein OsmY